MSSETFLAYNRPRKDGPAELIVGIDDDITTDIDRRNGWLEPGEPDEAGIDRKENEIEFGARGVRELFLFCFQGRTLDPRGKGMRTAFRRFAGVAWFYASNEMRGKDGKPLPLEKIASQPQIRCTKCALSLMAQEFRKQWGIAPSRVQKCDSSKPNYAASAKTGWAKRRARELTRRSKGNKGKTSLCKGSKGNTRLCNGSKGNTRLCNGSKGNIRQCKGSKGNTRQCRGSKGKRA